MAKTPKTTPKKTGYVNEGSEPPPEAETAELETVQARQARGILAIVRERIEKQAERATAFLERGEAAPESCASSLDEIASLFSGLASFVGARAAVLRYGPGEANRMLAVSARSVRSDCLAAGAELDQAPHSPTSWGVAEARVSEALKHIKAIRAVLSIEGMSDATRTDQPLTDAEGNPLAAS